MFFLHGIFSAVLLKAIVFSSYMYAFGQHEPGQETAVNDLRELHVAYAASIEIPVKAVDTLCIGRYELCGNTSDAEMRNFFLPDICGEPYTSALKKRYPEMVVTRNESKAMQLDLEGIRYSTDSVRITEYFSGQGQLITITKVAVYKNASWFIYPEKILNTNEQGK